jgi:1,2-diacylglycerol 3-beta-glucosyltransferase
VLLCFTARRLLFALTAAARMRGTASHQEVAVPVVTLLVPARNEQAGALATLAALDGLDYPADRLTILLIDDCSDDTTPDLFEAWCETRPSASVLRLPQPVGKYEALNEGIRSSTAASVLAVCDADVRPQPDWLRLLVLPLSDPHVGATAGYVAPANAGDGLFARYAAVELWVHQLVTSAAKDALGLNPPTLGACAYRREALDEVGRFGHSISGEDVRVSGALTRAGWRIRFVEAAVSHTLVVNTWQDYWHQHLRWARNVFSSRQARQSAAPDRPLTLLQRVETSLATAGYADRVALLVVVAGVRARVLPPWIPGVYAAVAAVEVVIAVAKAGHARGLPRFVAATGGLFPLDVIASTAAVVGQVVGRPRIWRHPRRSGR